MPGPYSSEGSVIDARALAANLGIRFEILQISEIVEAFKKTLCGVFMKYPEDVTEENIQSRIRGSLLMALSNKFGALVLSTGNKSELGVGYCTLYGDMAGGLAVINDVPKTLVYRLSRYVNSRRPVIPETTLEKPPSAELRPGQMDSDSLPPYEVLDAILEDYVEDARRAISIGPISIGEERPYGGTERVRRRKRRQEPRFLRRRSATGDVFQSLLKLTFKLNFEQGTNAIILAVPADAFILS